MSKTAIKFWQSKPLNQFVLNQDGSFTLVSLVTLGVIGAMLHQHLRLGLNLPGHHGLEWMALLLLGRCQSQHRWAATMVAVGAITTSLGQNALFASVLSLKAIIFYALNGLLLDTLFRIAPRNLPLAFKAVLLGGLTYMIKPLLLIPVVALFELKIGSFVKHGYLFPLMTHFVFGTIGALCGLAMVNAMDRIKQNTHIKR